MFADAPHAATDNRCAAFHENLEQNLGLPPLVSDAFRRVGRIKFTRRNYSLLLQRRLVSFVRAQNHSRPLPGRLASHRVRVSTLRFGRGYRCVASR